MLPCVLPLWLLLQGCEGRGTPGLLSEGLGRAELDLQCHSDHRVCPASLQQGRLWAPSASHSANSAAALLWSPLLLGGWVLRFVGAR